MNKEYEDAKEYIKSFIPANKLYLHTAEYGLEKVRNLLNIMGNPQNEFKSIHIAGTSGKTSTSYILSSILKSQGFKVGLTISPHILDIRERFQINNKPIAEERFAQYIKEIKPFVEIAEKSKFNHLTAYEVLIALAFYIFEKEEVDYAVIETGMGGYYDGSNMITREDKVVVLTPIGFDHTKILGNTLSKIAYQKAGIIKDKNKVFSQWQKPVVRRVFEKQALENHTDVSYIKEGESYKNIKIQTDKVVFDFSFESLLLKSIQLSLSSQFQAMNGSIGLAVLEYLSKRDGFNIKESNLRKELSDLYIIGRFDIRQYSDKKIIIDGAHSAQKMKALLGTIKKLFPDEKYNFVVSFKEGKDAVSMLKSLSKVADSINIASFIQNNQEMINLSMDANVIEDILEKIGYKKYKSFANSKNAIDYSITQPGITIVTGSLYFLKEVYELLSD